MERGPCQRGDWSRHSVHNTLSRRCDLAGLVIVVDIHRDDRRHRPQSPARWSLGLFWPYSNRGHEDLDLPASLRGIHERRDLANRYYIFHRPRLREDGARRPCGVPFREGLWEDDAWPCLRPGCHRGNHLPRDAVYYRPPRGGHAPDHLQPFAGLWLGPGQRHRAPHGRVPRHDRPAHRGHHLGPFHDRRSAEPPLQQARGLHRGAHVLVGLVVHGVVRPGPRQPRHHAARALQALPAGREGDARRAAGRCQEARGDGPGDARREDRPGRDGLPRGAVDLWPPDRRLGACRRDARPLRPRRHRRP
mmetsp:Transcript_16988/g.40533  ORF Transcript_16988/g.40533 Transcript_16988/m.40533 type:complete len:305 (-) Transcript_16988:637-1551(-)